VTTATFRPPSWPSRLRHLDRRSAVLVGLALTMPVITFLDPVQPLRAIAAGSVLLVLPGAAVARYLRLSDPLLFLVVTVAASLALTVLTSTALAYAGLASWHLTLLLMGLATAVMAGATGLAGARS
jgi:hypothetical protein